MEALNVITINNIVNENGVLFKVTQACSEKEIRVLLSGVEPKTFRLLVRMLYH